MITVPRITPQPQPAPQHATPTTILVTGAAGFIGSALIHELLRHTNHYILAIDALTYAGDHTNVPNDPRVTFARANILDTPYLTMLLKRFNPTIAYHLAAETHVDRSIDDPTIFMRTNALGTQALMDVLRRHWLTLPDAQRATTRFVHVSTDEVYGVAPENQKFTTSTPYAPRSPYAASKAASDHIVRAYHHTYGFPAVIAQPSNTYGPKQHPRNLIPQTIIRVTRGLPIRMTPDVFRLSDWMHVTDHARAILTTGMHANVGSTILIGADEPLMNLEIMHAITTELDRINPTQAPHSRNLASFTHRPGHDRGGRIDTTTIRNLGWTPQVPLVDGIRSTIHWYLSNSGWVDRRLLDAIDPPQAGERRL